MFKGFQNTRQQFKGFPALSFGMNNEAYGFSGCSFWLDAAYGLNTQTNGASISWWVEKIQGLVFTQSTGANQPTLTTSAAGFNSLPIVNFFTGNRNMIASQNFGFIKGGTIAIVFQKNSAPVQFNNLFARSNVNLNTIGLGNATGTKLGIFSSTGTEVMVATVGDTNPHILVITSDEIVYDGVQVATGSWNLDAAFTHIGGGVESTNRNLLASIAEIVAYNQHLDSDETITLSNNLNSKYAIY